MSKFQIRFTLLLAIESAMITGAFTMHAALAADESVAVKTELKYRSARAGNPLKGLVPYQNPERDRFPHSMEFSYLPLARLVVGRDQYDWRPLEKMLDDIKSRGNQTVFRIFLEYPGKKNCIPKYLVDGGLKVHRYSNTNTAPLPPTPVETPDYEDADLRECLQNFIAALGSRYDGDPRVAYITAGLLGTWGEWHTYPRDELWASKTVQREVLTAFESAFQKTPVLLRYPAGKGHYAQAANHDRPFGYHDDSFAHATLRTGRQQDDWFFEPALIDADATEKWKTQPIGGEIRPEVWGCCFDEPPCTAATQHFDACRDALHVTWLMDSGMFEQKASAKRHRRAIRSVQKMGYEFHVAHAQLSEQTLTLNIQNTGIAPFYHSGWQLRIGHLRDGRVKTAQPTDCNLRGLLPGESVELVIHLERPLTAGDTLAIAMPNPMSGGKPMRFANATQGQHVDSWLSLFTAP